MGTTTAPSASPPASRAKQRIWKCLVASLGVLLFLAIAYSQPLGREAYVHFVGMFGPRAVPWLLPALQDSNGGVRLVANAKISGMGTTAFPHLLKQLNSSRPGTRATAAMMLGSSNIHVGNETQVSDALLKTLDDRDPGVRLAAIQAQANLRRSAIKALPRLKAMLDNSDTTVRVGALRAVVAIDPASPETLASVLKMLKDLDPKIRTEACSTLEHTGTRDPSAVAALIAALHDPALEVRAAAIDYLGEIGPNGKLAIPALQDVSVHDPDANIRNQAAQSIESLKELPEP